MEQEDVECALCKRIYGPTGDSVPRLIPENGLTYCTACVQQMIDDSTGQESFFTPEDDETPIGRKAKAENYPKNMGMLKMAKRYQDKLEKLQREGTIVSQNPVAFGEDMKGSMVSNDGRGSVQVGSIISQNEPQAVPEKESDLCSIHGKKLDIICIDCKERICSQCALFGPHKNHEIRMEQDVLEEINLRTECLMEMFQIVTQTASEKPDENQVNVLMQEFQIKSEEMKKTLKQKFRDMRTMLKVQEQTTDAILKKNLQYVENELKNLKNIDYRMFTDADKWMKNAKLKLDNFEANNENPHYIAFDMLANAKDEFMKMDVNEDDLLADEIQTTRGKDMITYGEKIAEQLGKIKAINPNVLSQQLGQLTLTFNDKTISDISTVSKCNAIDGVSVSDEQLEAIREAANAQQDAGDDFAEDMNQFSNEMKGFGNNIQIGQSKIGGQNKQPDIAKPEPLIVNKTNIVKNQSIQPPQMEPIQVMQKQKQISVPEPQVNYQKIELQQEQWGAAESIQQPQNTDPGPTDEGDIDPEFMAEIETYLKECMENNELSIDMSDTLIKDHGAKMVAAAASLCDQLQELRLQQCGITDDGAIELFKELQPLPNLQVIDLSFNPITDASLGPLTNLLNSNQNLVINMRMNDIKNKFAARKMQHFEQQGRLNIQNQ